MRFSIMLPIVVMLLQACSGGGVTPCGDTAIAVDGECVGRLACGPGTTQRDLECVPTGGSCGDNTREVDGSCVPATDVVCSEGTHVVDGVCVADDALACGAGTTMVDGACLPTTTLICGPGTVLVEDDSGDTCELRCEPPEIWSVPDSACVSQCGADTLFDVENGVCEPRCGEAEFYDPFTETCLGVPECGVGTMQNPDTAECEGWPFQDLSLDTICARRAVNACERVFNCCEDAYLVSRHLDTMYTRSAREGAETRYDSDFVDFPVDEATCRNMEFWECETNGVAAIRAAIASAAAEVNSDGLTAFDDFYAFVGCEQPIDRLLWDYELVDDLFNPLLATGDECTEERYCTGDAICTYGAETRVSTCQPRGELNAICAERYLYDLQDSCQDGLICLDIGHADGKRRCQARHAENEECDYADMNIWSDNGCAEGLICRRASYGAEGTTVCLPPIAADDTTSTCPVADEYYDIDWCGPNLYCRDDAVPDLDGVGKCAATRDRAGACELPTERNFYDYESPSGHSICDDELLCTLQPDEDDFVGSCSDTESVCNYLLTQCGLYEALGEVCESNE